MKVTLRSVTFGLMSSAIILVGCSPTENPHLSVCQDITQNLMPGQKLSWDKHTESESETELRIDLTFASSSGASMQSSCSFLADPGEESAVNQIEYDNAPTSVVLNGQQVDQASLARATVGATNKAVKDMAEHTAQQSKENYEAASQKTRELAHETSEKAREMAGRATESARQATLDAAAKVQQALEK